MGDVLIRFNGDDIHALAQKEVVPLFAKAGTNPIHLVVKSVGQFDYSNVLIDYLH